MLPYKEKEHTFMHLIMVTWIYNNLKMLYLKSICYGEFAYNPILLVAG